MQIPSQIDLDERIIAQVAQLESLLSVEEVASFLRVAKSTIRKEIYAKRLVAYQAEGSYCISRYDLLCYLDSISNLNVQW